MGGIVRAITGGESKEQKRAKRASQALAAADAERAGRLEKQKAEEDLVARERKKKKKRTRTVFTSPLGLSDNGTDTLA